MVKITFQEDPVSVRTMHWFVHSALTEHLLSARTWLHCRGETEDGGQAEGIIVIIPGTGTRAWTTVGAEPKEAPSALLCRPSGAPPCLIIMQCRG